MKGERTTVEVRLKKLAAGVYVKREKRTRSPALHCAVGQLFKRFAQLERSKLGRRVDVDGRSLKLLAELCSISIAMPVEETFIVSLSNGLKMRVIYYDGNESPWHFQYLALGIFGLYQVGEIVPIALVEYRQYLHKVRVLEGKLGGFDTSALFGFGGFNHNGACSPGHLQKYARDVADTLTMIAEMETEVLKGVISVIQAARSAKKKPAQAAPETAA